MANPDFSPQAVEAMLKMASAKLGMSPEQLKSTIQDPKNADALLSGLEKKTGQNVKSAARNPQSFDELLASNPKLKKLLAELLGEGKNG